MPYTDHDLAEILNRPGYRISRDSASLTRRSPKQADSPSAPLPVQYAPKAAKSATPRLALAMSEADLLSNIREMARMTGWMAYHTHDSRRSDEGFPDLVLVRKNRVLFVELKSEKGKPSPAQIEWLHALMLTRRVETFLWRPSDWLNGTIEGMLR